MTVPKQPGRRRSFAAIVSQNRAGDPFYSSAAWRQLRRARLSIDNYLCQDCLSKNKTTEAREVDHVLPRATHPHLELAIENTRSLCKPCHSRKTRRDEQAHVTRETSRNEITTYDDDHSKTPCFIGSFYAVFYRLFRGGAVAF